MNTSSGGLSFGFVDPITKWLGDHYKRITRRMFETNDLKMRWGAAFLVYILLLIPDMIVLAQWTTEFLTLQPKEQDLKHLTIDYAFEALILMLISIFAISILIALTTDAPVLKYGVLVVAWGMVFYGALLLGITSTRCLIDLQCDGRLFIAAQIIIGVVTLFGYFLPRALHHNAQFLVAAFVGVGVWETWLWMWQCYNHQGVPINADSLRGLALIFITWAYMALFATATNLRPPPPR